MDMVRIFHMTRGLGETSYAQNSRLQGKAIESAMNVTLISAMEACAVETVLPATVSIADLGSSSGRNTLSVVENIIRAVCGRRREAMRQLPEFMVFLNDLPSNDFNTLFSLVPEFVQQLKTEHGGGILQVSVAGVPGSFYGRLFPSSSLHFVTSFTSLHWLSQVPAGLLNKGEPVNKGNVYMSPTSPPSVAIRYFEQFREDFSLFLRSRSQELVVGGRIVLSMIGRKSHDSHKKINEFSDFEALGKSLSIFVSQKLVAEEKVDSFNLPFYTPSTQELEEQVYREGSFTIDSMKQDFLDWTIEYAPKMLSKFCRAATESLICHHFGEEIIEPLFETHAQVLHEKLAAREDIGWCQIIVVLCKSAAAR